MQKEMSSEKEIIVVKSLLLTRSGFHAEFNIPVAQIFEPIPGARFDGRKMMVKNFWDWRNYLNICLKYYGKPNANYDYFFDSTDNWSSSGGFERARYRPEKRAKSPYLAHLGNKIGGVTKLERLDTIPTSVNFSQKREPSA